jgi:hypothetical protein
MSTANVAYFEPDELVVIACFDRSQIVRTSIAEIDLERGLITTRCGSTFQVNKDGVPVKISDPNVFLKKRGTTMPLGIKPLKRSID